MENAQKWYQSKIVRLALALVIGGLSYFGVSYGVIDANDLDAASTVYPEVGNAVSLIIAGQWVAGGVALIGILIGYFRIFKTSKVIALKGGETSYGKAA